MQPYGWPEKIGSVVSLTILVGLLVPLDGMPWSSTMGGL